MDSIISVPDFTTQSSDSNHFLMRLIVDITVNDLNYHGTFSSAPNAIFVTAFSVGVELSLCGVLMSPSTSSILSETTGGGMVSSKLAFTWSSRLAYYCAVSGTVGALPNSFHITIFEIYQ